jgi:hypothetical protein
MNDFIDSSGNIIEHEPIGNEIAYDKQKELIKQQFERIKEVLRYYLDMKEDYYDLIATWIIGAWLHKQFITYPYLFFNAMRGSGKSRTLKLIAELTPNGQHIVSISEAVLFRTASFSTFCIDEFERVGSKEKQSLRELLNAAYKKGMKVKRAYKKNSKERESVEVEEFDVYCPIVMANIFGQDDILSDRCITLILEKSNSDKTMLLEDYTLNNVIKNIKANFQCSLCSVVVEKQYKEWNEYVNNIIRTTPIHLTTLTTQTTQNYTFEKIKESGLKGRDLELFFPLFLIAEQCNNLEKLIKIAKEIVASKTKEDIIENKDISVYGFIGELNTEDWLQMKWLINEFKQKTDSDEEWCNAKWLGHALKRLNLVVEKRRLGQGIEVRLNTNKAREKLGMFKPEIKVERIENEER